MKMKYVALLTSLCVAPLIGFAGSAHSSKGKTITLKNERGSVLQLEFNTQKKHSGQVTGTFKTAVASKECRKAVGTVRPVTGFYSGNAISMSVSYPKCKSVLSITGNFDKKNQLSTLWIIDRSDRKFKSKSVQTRSIGNDLFLPVKKIS